MTLTDLLAELRTRLDDSTCQPLWTDAQLVGYLNDAVRQVCLRQRALTESINETVCQYALTVGQRQVKLHPSILAVRSARITDADTGDTDCASCTGCAHPSMQGVTLRYLQRRYPHWETVDNGIPHYWLPDYQEGYLTLSRPVECAGTLYLTVWRAPSDDFDELLDVNDPTSEPAISEHWHLDLVDWAAYRAFNNKDGEETDDARASAAAAAFEAKIGRLPSATEIRLWGVSRLVGTTFEPL